MKALTIWQPWASFIAVEQKRFETRSWATSYRGPIAIHAAKKKVAASLYPAELKIEEVWKFMETLGCVVAVAELAGCYKIERVGGGVGIRINGQIFMPPTKEVALGDWRPGRYAWDMQKVRALEKPVPASGNQGLWNWNEEGLR